MNKRSVLISWGVICVMAVLTSTLYVYHWHKQYEFSCQGIVNSFGRNVTVQHFINVKVADGKGRFDIIEQVHVSEKQSPKKIINTLFFHYSREENALIMVSDNDNQYADYLKPVTSIPDFFLYQDRGLTVKVVPVNRNAYLFIDGETSVFYCSKKEFFEIK